MKNLLFFVYLSSVVEEIKKITLEYPSTSSNIQNTRKSFTNHNFKMLKAQ